MKGERPECTETAPKRLTINPSLNQLSHPPEGVKAEAAFAKDKTLPDPNSTTNPEFKIVLSIIKDTLQKVRGSCWAVCGGRFGGWLVCLDSK